MALNNQPRRPVSSANGRNGDSELLHVNPDEKSFVVSLLKSLGGAGTRNPVDGALEFYGGAGMGGPGSPGAGDSGGAHDASDGGGARGGNQGGRGGGGFGKSDLGRNSTPQARGDASVDSGGQFTGPSAARDRLGSDQPGQRPGGSLAARDPNSSVTGGETPQARGNVRVGENGDIRSANFAERVGDFFSGALTKSPPTADPTFNAFMSALGAIVPGLNLGLAFTRGMQAATGQPGVNGPGGESRGDTKGGADNSGLQNNADIPSPVDTSSSTNSGVAVSGGTTSTTELAQANPPVTGVPVPQSDAQRRRRGSGLTGIGSMGFVI